MKKTLTVNLNGQVFHIDQDAYEALDKYLKSVERKFGNSNEGKEITADIEARVAELFNEKLQGSRQVISLPDVNEIIEILGHPYEFEEEPGEVYEPTIGRRKKMRKIFRDPDDKVIGGVCSGLGHYLGLQPIIPRLIFVLLFIFAGTGFIVYLILWLIIPEAQTTAQKLEMRGEPVTLESMSNFMNDEINNLRSKMNFGKKNK